MSNHAFKFKAGDYVRVSQDYHWAQGAVGKIDSSEPKIVSVNRSSDSDAASSKATEIHYMVWFQKSYLDADGDGPYKGGSIPESKLLHISFWKSLFGRFFY